MQQYQNWENYFENDLKKIKKGYLIYFKTYGNNPVSHVGIYSGRNNFIHAPKKNDFVKESHLSGYWLKKFVGYIDIEKVYK